MLKTDVLGHFYTFMERKEFASSLYNPVENFYFCRRGTQHQNAERLG
jgi:hypothetical protein